MGTTDRHRLIAELLRGQEEVTVDELVSTTGASGATIRRDLEILAANGVLKRVHGVPAASWPVERTPATGSANSRTTRPKPA